MSRLDMPRGLIVHSDRPLNAEPPLGRLRAAFLTPQGDFYIRCHGSIPSLDAAAHRLRVEGRVRTKLDVAVAELRAGFPERRLTATLQCAGNRRGDLGRVRAVSGDPWHAGAIGNAEWTGVALADVLRAADVEDGAAHVAFAACDECELDGQHFRYGVSIPTDKAMAPEVLLAWAMNGEPLAPEHGFPLRLVVPGFAGVRSAKWLAAITVQDQPSDTPIQNSDYKLFPPHVTKATADPARGLTIDDMPINSVICDPAAQSTLPAGKLTVRGYAIATVRRVARVDVSADDGRSWRQASLLPAPAWSWTFWEATLDLPPGEHALVVRAWDAAGHTQPARLEEVWNHKGYLDTAWHRVPVRVI